MEHVYSQKIEGDLSVFTILLNAKTAVWVLVSPIPHTAVS